MVITLNGQPENLDGSMTIRDLLEKKALEPDTVVVEVNLEIIDRDTFHETAIRDRDVIEILRFVGGG
jgi:sulfur carrier protein